MFFSVLRIQTRKVETFQPQGFFYSHWLLKNNFESLNNLCLMLFSVICVFLKESHLGNYSKISTVNIIETHDDTISAEYNDNIFFYLTLRPLTLWCIYMCTMLNSGWKNYCSLHKVPVESVSVEIVCQGGVSLIHLHKRVNTDFEWTEKLSLKLMLVATNLLGGGPRA